MELKDWLMLLIPIFCNGVVVFLLQKLFEKKQIKRQIQQEYYSELRRRIDLGLELHAKATRLANEDDTDKSEEINLTIQQFFNSCLDGYYYYVQNKIVFSLVEKDFEELASLLLHFSKGVNQQELTALQISDIVNVIRDVLQEIKKKIMR